MSSESKVNKNISKAIDESITNILNVLANKNCYNIDKKFYLSEEFKVYLTLLRDFSNVISGYNSFPSIGTQASFERFKENINSFYYNLLNDQHELEINKNRMFLRWSVKRYHIITRSKSLVKLVNNYLLKMKTNVDIPIKNEIKKSLHKIIMSIIRLLNSYRKFLVLTLFSYKDHSENIYKCAMEPITKIINEYLYDDFIEKINETLINSSHSDIMSEKDYIDLFLKMKFLPSICDIIVLDIYMNLVSMILWIIVDRYSSLDKSYDYYIDYINSIMESTQSINEEIDYIINNYNLVDITYNLITSSLFLLLFNFNLYDYNTLSKFPHKFVTINYYFDTCDPKLNFIKNKIIGFTLNSKKGRKINKYTFDLYYRLYLNETINEYFMNRFEKQDSINFMDYTSLGIMKDLIRYAKNKLEDLFGSSLEDLDKVKTNMLSILVQIINLLNNSIDYFEPYAEKIFNNEVEEVYLENRFTLPLIKDKNRMLKTLFNLSLLINESNFEPDNKLYIRGVISPTKMGVKFICRFKNDEEIIFETETKFSKQMLLILKHFKSFISSLQVNLNNEIYDTILSFIDKNDVTTNEKLNEKLLKLFYLANTNRR